MKIIAKIVSKTAQLQVVMMIFEFVLLILEVYLMISGHKREVRICALVLILVSLVNIALGSFSRRISKELGKCALHVDIIDNIVKVTVLNYFYAKKYHMKFDIEKIERELNPDDLNIISVPDMFSEEPASDEEIMKSIEYMKDWNIDIIHRVLTTSLVRGYITGAQRRFLLDHALDNINNINDKAFHVKMMKDGSGTYKLYYKHATEEEMRCSQ